jgi:hypothetical protein
MGMEVSYEPGTYAARLERTLPEVRERIERAA